MDKDKLPKVAVAARPGVKGGISASAAARWNPDVRAAASDDAAHSISILDPIGADPWGEGVTAKRIGAALRSIGGADVVVNINSPGGDFFEGLAIYNLLREYAGKVTVRVLGMAASAASIIAMAADEILIGRAAFLMIHNTWVMAAGDRHALRDVGDWLEPFDQAAVGIYAARTGLSEKDLAAMLDRETWIGGAAAVEKKFADGLLSADEVDAAQAAQAAGDLTPLAAAKKVDLLLAGLATKSERRALVAALKTGGTSGAAPSAGTSRAAISETAQSALQKLNSL